MKSLTKKIYASLTLCAVFGLAACANTQSANNSNLSSGDRKVVSQPQMQQEYKDSVAKLEWPSGYTPPAEVTGEEPDATYQSGYGDSRASMLFECAWSRAWLRSYASDKDAAAAAVRQLEKIPNMGYMSKERADDATRRIFKENLEKMKLGDPSGIQNFVTLNC